MRKSFTFIISSISLLVLILIQIYVLMSYYKVKSKNFDITYSNAVLNSINSKDHYFLFDKLDSAFNRLAKSFFLEYTHYSDPDFQQSVVAKFDSVLIEFDKNPERIKKYTVENNLDTNFQSNYITNEIYLIDFENKIEVYKSINTDNINQDEEGFYIKSYYKEGNYYEVQYDYYVDFTHKHRVIFTEIRGLLILVILTLVTVIFAFAYTLFTLQRQKKLTELKDDFIDSITHEFTTPLSTISVAISSLKQQNKQKDISKYSEICNALEKQNKFLSRMIDNVIDVNIFERNTTSENKKPILIKKAVHEIINSFVENETSETNIKISEDYSISDDFKYTLDPVQFERTINNILSNAVKYCDRDPVINIRIWSDNQLNIEIKDNGIGIMEEEQENVFNKFYRAGKQTTTKGLGLGLYIIKKIIENHNGNINLKSTYGEGTTVTISLPL